MEVMTERSVGGAVDLDYDPSGLVWRLTCRAAKALDPPANLSRAYPALVAEAAEGGSMDTDASPADLRCRRAPKC